MADSRAGAEENQDEPGVLRVPESEEAPKNPWEHDEKAQGPTCGSSCPPQEHNLNKINNSGTGL